MIYAFSKLNVQVFNIALFKGSSIAVVLIYIVVLYVAWLLNHVTGAYVVLLFVYVTGK